MKLLKQNIKQLIAEAISLDLEKGDVILTGRYKNKRKIVKSIGTDEWGQPTVNGKSILKFKIEKKMPKEKWSAKSREEEKSLREAVRQIILEDYKVRGYIKPSNAFHSLDAWEKIVNMFLRYQEIGVDSRSGEAFPKELSMLINSFFPMLETEIERYEQFTRRNAMNFIEDFVNHRFWSLKKQYSSYVPDIDSLKFAYFYSRGDIEPYVLLDENWTMSIYGSLDIQKEVKHYTTEEGLQNLINAIESGNPFDISTFTTQKKEYFDSNSSLCITLIGNVRAAFRSDVKSFATSSGRRAMNLYRLDYPGDDLTNICYDLEDCTPERTALWDELIITPLEITKVETMP